MSEPLKIFAISLTSIKPYKAYGAFDGELLAIVEATPIIGPMAQWKDPLIAEIKAKIKQGFVVIVEEKTEIIAQHGSQYLLEEVNDEGRSNYFDALDWYFAMQDLGSIVFAPDVKQFAFQASGEGSRIERKQDDKGRPVYNVNWQSFHGAYRAILLCVVAATQEPVSGRFLEDMFGPGMPDSEPEHPVPRWLTLISSIGKAKETELMEKRKQI